MTWPVGQAVKTAASHAANMGSIPVRVTSFEIYLDIPRKSVIILTVGKTVRREKCDVFFAYFLFKRKVQLVLIRARVHPFPFRTRKLSSLLPKILVWREGKQKREHRKAFFAYFLSRKKVCAFSSVGRATDS